MLSSLRYEQNILCRIINVIMASKTDQIITAITTTGLFNEPSTMICMELNCHCILFIIILFPDFKKAKRTYDIQCSFSENMRIVSRRNMDIFVQSSRMLSRSISTAEIRCVALPASGVQAVGRKTSSCFPARHADSVLPVMPSTLRRGVSLYEKNLSFLEPSILPFWA
jgi:hypothetical protein